MEWKPELGLYLPHLHAKIRRGRGIGTGKEYTPWLKVREVPSHGTSSTIGGILVARPFHLLSKLETTYFYLQERKATTIDIREQFPILDMAETLDICGKLGVRHPYRGIYPEPVTIDFLITELVDKRIRYRAAGIKTPEDAADQKIQQNLRIQYEWCRARDIPWVLVDTTRFNDTVLENLRFMRSWHRHRYSPKRAISERYAALFKQNYQRNVPLCSLIEVVAEQMQIQIAPAEDAFRYCAWKNMIPVSLHHGLSLNDPVVMDHGKS